MQDVKSVIFDFDGTLFDSMQVWYHFESELLRSYGKEPKPGLAEVLRALSSIEEAEYLIKEYGVERTVDEIIFDRNSKILENYSQTIPLKDGAIEVMEALKERNIPMCIATATERVLIAPAVKRLGLSKYIDRVFTCEEVGKSKSFPDIFIEAANFMGTKPEETLVVEDALYAIITAKKAGFIVAGLYDLSSIDVKDEIIELSDYYHETLHDMHRLIECRE
ncbi:MAG: HAD family phosphatase [Oscillospiraceae bacterium]|jgi:HAD superfamily hydrolase (TIGR01509 family)|nr:HAD family phosphatase [Oscillospiraceae bacterium]